MALTEMGIMLCSSSLYEQNMGKKFTHEIFMSYSTIITNFVYYDYSLSPNEEQFFDSIVIAQLCGTIRHFVERIEDGYYDFYSLPSGMKKPLTEKDCKTIQDTFQGISLG